MVQRISLQSYPQLFKRATASLMNQQYTKSQNQFKKCLQANPSSYSSYLNLAYINHLKQDYQLVIKLCDVAINIKPYCSQAYYNRCLALLKLGQSHYVGAYQQINAALSCLYLQKFKLNGQVKLLQTAISYCENNLQAVRMIILCGDRQKKQFYKKILTKYQDKYAISGEIDSIKYCAVAQQGLFRLKSTISNNKINQIKRKICLYLTLLSEQNYLLFPNPRQKGKLLLDSQIYSIKIQSTLTNDSQLIYQQIQMKQLCRNATNSNNLIQNFNFNLISPTSSSKFSRYSFVDSIKSIKANSICDSRISNTKICHNGCIKCRQQSKELLIPFDSIKIYIKTVQIFRNQNIFQPKPYLIVYDGQNTHLTEVDYSGGYFPKWNKIFHLSRNTEAPYRIQLWHKGNYQKQDILIGTTSFDFKQGRFKCYFIKHYGGAKRTGYAFLQLSK